MNKPQAVTVADTFNSEMFMAFSFEHGIGARYHGQPQATLPMGKPIKVRRNPNGRVSFALYEYADGSQLSFKYHEDRGAHVSVVRKH